MNTAKQNRITPPLIQVHRDAEEEMQGSVPGICECLESLRHTVERLEERAREMEMALSYVLPQLPTEVQPDRLQGSHLPPNFPPAVAEIIAIEARVIDILAKIERLTENVAI
jgi:hypothetical protein